MSDIQRFVLAIDARNPALALEELMRRIQSGELAVTDFSNEGYVHPDDRALPCTVPPEGYFVVHGEIDENTDYYFAIPRGEGFDVLEKCEFCVEFWGGHWRLRDALKGDKALLWDDGAWVKNTMH
ncbi:MAG: hypothetical protein K2W82_16500 [Candidatus Obscuribacterales bacterium]|nr:hypothetical protein [Candidatus Obscuribacterales bacterium]